MSRRRADPSRGLATDYEVAVSMSVATEDGRRDEYILVLFAALRLFDLPKDIEPEITYLRRQPIEHLRAACRHQRGDAHRRQLAEARLRHIVELDREKNGAGAQLATRVEEREGVALDYVPASTTG